MCGFYLNELLLRLLPRDDPHDALDFYAEALALLLIGRRAGADPEKLREAAARRARVCSAA